MVQTRLSMRRIKEILRLRAELGLSERRISASVGASRSSVQQCLQRARAEGLAWPDCSEFSEEQLYARLYRRLGRPTKTVAELPDFAKIHVELARKGVTRELLWQEYKAGCPQGLQYTTFCTQYRAWLATHETVFRQNHVPGEKLFVDYAGQTVAIIDSANGAAHPAQIFVAVLGASNYTFAEATASQSLPDWLGSHVRALKFLGGVPRIIVPDNLRSAVTKAHRYDPELNPSYAELAQHYGLAVLPARVRKPRDKAKVETGVLLVTRWILARLRHQTFFSLGELNESIAHWVKVLNERPFKKMEGSRLSRFEATERGCLAALPLRHYEFAQWKHVKVHPDYHVQIDKMFYSVPYRLVGQTLDARVGAQMFELFLRGKLVSSHYRGTILGHFYTLPEHRAPAHSAQIDQTMERMFSRAAQIGPATREVIQRQASHRKHPEQTLRAAQGIVRMAQDFSAAQLEQACLRALGLGVYSYRAVHTLIKSAVPEAPIATTAPEHANVRGADYFH